MNWFLIFFEYMQVWWLFTIKTFDFFWVYAGFEHFWHQHVDFFLSMRVWWISSLSNLHFCNQKQKRRIDTLDMFFLFDNFPDAKEIHKMFKYNEHFSTTWSTIIDTFKRGIKHKELLDRHCKAPCRDPDLTLKTIKKNIRYVTVSPHKITYANFPLKATFYLKR